MVRVSILGCLLAVCLLTSVTPLAAWPVDVYPEIFENARKTLPPALQRLIADLEPVFSQPCETRDALAVEATAARAIQELSSPAGDLRQAVAFLRETGCGAAALNDPAEAAIDRLVASQKERFAVVFYGWHPLIRDGDLAGYLAIRHTEHQRLQERFGRTSELPDLSDQVELSPEYGLASIAFSRAVTDVANVWMYVWSSVNGAF